ncbi:MAG: HD domain-containing protein [Spirochaetes bacterium]|nr:HD domain-containing protein [Spirochaetota bacterium]
MKQSKKIIILIIIFSYFYPAFLNADTKIEINYNEGLKYYLLKDYRKSIKYLEKAYSTDPYFKKTAELYKSSMENFGEELYNKQNFSDAEEIYLKLQTIFPSDRYKSKINLLKMLNREKYAYLKIADIQLKKKELNKYLKYETEANRIILRKFISKGKKEKNIVYSYLQIFYSQKINSPGLIQSILYLFLSAGLLILAVFLFQFSLKLKFVIKAHELYTEGKMHLPHINMKSMNPKRFIKWNPDFEKYMTFSRTMKIGQAVDKITGRQSHNIEVGNLAFHIAEKLDLPNLNPDDVQKIGFIHDVGYIRLTKELLLRGRTLKNADFKDIKKHISQGVKFFKRKNLPDLYKNGLIHHHERYDGTGYPKGLKGKKIPLIARIISISDFIITLTSYSESRHPVSIVTALSMLDNLSGKHFDPELVKLVKSIYLE